MMRWLVDVSIRLRIVILLVAGMLMIGWLRSAGQIPFDVFPEFAPPLVEIQTEAPGLSTAEVEAQIDGIAGDVPPAAAHGGTSDRYKNTFAEAARPPDCVR